MKIKKLTARTFNLMLHIAALLVFVSTTLAASSTNYAINWVQAGAGGGENQTSLSYHLAITLGQAVAGNPQSANYHAQLGYRQAWLVSTAAPTTTPIPSATATSTPSTTPTPTATSIPVNTVTNTPTATPSPTDTPTTIPTVTSTPTQPPDMTYTPTVPPSTTTTNTATAQPTAMPSTIPTQTLIPSSTPTDCPIPFVDVSGNVFYSAIKFLYCRGVVNGTDTSHYSPAGTSTRAQFAKVVVLGFGIQSYTPAQPSFSDVTPAYFAYPYIESGFHYGVLSGYDAATCGAIGVSFPCYGPGRPITRAQLTKLVVNAASYPPYTPSDGQTFSDVGTNNVFYISIETAHYKGVINGYPDNTFRPGTFIRRDEMAQIVYKGVTTPP